MFHIEGCDTALYNRNYYYQEVRYFINEQWYYVCSENFTETEANLICLEQGNYGVRSIENNIMLNEATESFPIYPYALVCDGNEASLCDCNATQQICTSNSIAAIECILPGNFGFLIGVYVCTFFVNIFKTIDILYTLYVDTLLINL